MTDLQKMLDAQRAIQTKVYGADPIDLTDEQRVQYIKDMVLAAEDELHEMLVEVPAWKPWVNREKLIKEGIPFVRDAAFQKEFSDLWHFVLILALLGGITEARQIEDLYFNKYEVNKKRQSDGYTGNKCICGRAFDDETTDCSPEHCTNTLF